MGFGVDFSLTEIEQKSQESILDWGEGEAMCFPHTCFPFHRGKVLDGIGTESKPLDPQVKEPPKPPDPMVLGYSAAIWMHLTLDTPKTVGYTFAFSFMTE